MDRAVYRYAAGADAEAHGIDIALYSAGEAQGGSLDNAVGSHYFIVVFCADVGVSVQLVDDTGHGNVHGHRSATQGNDISGSIAVEVMANVHRCVLGINAHVIANRAADIRAVERQGYARVHRHGAAGCGCRCNSGVSCAGGGDIDAVSRSHCRPLCWTRRRTQTASKR